MPWVIIGDFNMTPTELQRTTFYKALGGVIRTPDGVEGTCAQKKKTRHNVRLCTHEPNCSVSREGPHGGPSCSVETACWPRAVFEGLGANSENPRAHLAIEAAPGAETETGTYARI